MPYTSSCPRCQQTVTIPTTPSDQAVVQCPGCRQQFDLSEALDFVAETEEQPLPPELIVISAGSGQETGAGEPSAAGRPASSPEPAESPVDVRCPCCRQVFPLQALLLATTDEPLGPQAAAAILSREPPEGSEAEGGARFAFGAPAGRDDHSGFRLQLGGDQPPQPAGGFEFAAPIGTSERSGGAESRGTTPRRRPRRDRGGLKDFIGAILGGAAGLVIAYYMLNLIGGRRFDFLQVYLPGVKHTAAHRPDWLGGPPQAPKEESESGLGDSMPPEAGPAGNGGAVSPLGGLAAEAKPPGQEAPPEGVPDLPDAPALPADYVGLVHPPEIAPDLLGASLKAVADATKPGGLTEEGFAAWCRLAEAVTFVDRSGGGAQMQNRLDAVRRLLRDLSAEDYARIGQWAGARLADSGRDGGGILLVGTANKPNSERGGGYLMGLQVAGTGERVVVASAGKLPLVQDDRLLLLGQIVDQPSESIRGIDTELPQVVWSGMVLKCSR